MSDENLPLPPEFALIAEFRSMLSRTLPSDVVGIGDDCALFPSGNADEQYLITTDLLLENKHFRFGGTTLRDLGWKTLAVNLSDIAACGGEPMLAVLNLGVPRGKSAIASEIYQGILESATEYHLAIVGGDTVESDQFLLGATVLGRTHYPLLRSGAKDGDDIWLSGNIGDAGLGLALENSEIESSKLADQGALARNRLHRPIPRIELGRKLSLKRLATSAIDVSDGLIQDAGHIARASGVKCIIELEAVPYSKLENSSWTSLRAMSAGDDYEILFTADPKFRNEIAQLGSRELQLRRIGMVELSASPGVWLSQAGKPTVLASELLLAAGLPASGGYSHLM